MRIHASAWLGIAALLCTRGAAADWPSGGQNVHDTRFAADESRIRPTNAGRLAPAWVFTTAGNVSATPAVDDDALYIPDWGGQFYKIDKQQGTVIWQRTVSDYTGIARTVSRTAPAIHGDDVIIGSLSGAYLMAFRRNTGALHWKTQLDPYWAAQITQSPVVHGNRVYIGVSSNEEVAPSGTCCSFRGSVLALDARTGAILWRTRTMPEGYSGGSVWGGTPVVDEKRHLLYVTTGNNYSVPPDVAACALAAGDDAQAADACLAPDDWVDSFLALDLDTGVVQWGRRMQGYDAWTGACFYDTNSPLCPHPLGDDYDLGTGAALFTVGEGCHQRDLVGSGQKSGIYWALDPDDGSVVWRTQVGPGGIMGGIEWGTATDGRRIYVAAANTGHVAYQLAHSTTTIDWGSWAALDAATGEILWQRADPTAGAVDTGMVTVANGVVFAGSMDDAGHMYAFDAATGNTLWSYASGGSVVAGAAVDDGRVYWGSGYNSFFVGKPNNQLYAFALR